MLLCFFLILVVLYFVVLSFIIVEDDINVFDLGDINEEKDVYYDLFFVDFDMIKVDVYLFF